MNKIVVFDGGFGGELFADQLEAALPVVDTIRVIDWRNANDLQSSAHKARKLTEDALRPHFNKVDLIVLANHFVSTTSLKYFQKKYQNQNFIGLGLNPPQPSNKSKTKEPTNKKIKRNALILTTKPLTRTFDFQKYCLKLKRNTKILALDNWPSKIDDGELTQTEITETMRLFLSREKFKPQEVILLCSQFKDITTELRVALGHNIKICDDFDNAMKSIYKILKIRGGSGKKS